MSDSLLDKAMDGFVCPVIGWFVVLTTGVFAFGAVFLGFSLAACSLETADSERTSGEIRDVSFYPQHLEQSCGAKTGCHNITVPDKWWLNVCDSAPSKACRVIRIEHAPWAWQTVGAKITLHWQQSCFLGSMTWDVASFEERT